MSAALKPETTAHMLADAEHRYVLALRMALAAQSEPGWREHLLRPEEFSSPAIRAIVETWGELAATHEHPIDADVMRVLIERGQRDHAMRLVDLVVDAPHDWEWLPGELRSIAALVRELGARARRERVLAAANDAASAGRVVDIADIRERLEEAGQVPGQALPTYTQHRLVELGTEEWVRRIESQGRPWHAMLGIEALDEAIGGLDRGDLVVIGARPSAGKSALLLRIVQGAARHGLRSAIFSLEDSPEKWGTRELASAGQLGASNLRLGGSLSRNELERMRAIDVHERWRVVDCRARRDVSMLVPYMRRVVREHSIDIIALDYAQLVKVRGAKERRLEVEAAASSLKAAAAELGVTLVLASQLRRHDGPPSLDTLKEAGALEEQAEVVLLLHRVRSDAGDEVYAEIAKNKSGEAGTLWRLGWDGRSVRFVEADRVHGGWGSVLGTAKRGTRAPGQYGRGFTRSADAEEFRDE
jgi:replicative DNA helicase